MNTRPELRFFFDAGSGICLWAGNDAATERHDFAVDVDELPLTDDTRSGLRKLITWYDTSIDWNDPAGPSPWSPQERERFNTAVQDLVPRLEQELAAGGYDMFDETCTSPQPDEPFELLLRIFAAAADSAQAAAQAQTLLNALSAYSPRQVGLPEPYWKVPQWYEHTFALNPADLATFDAVINLAQGNWDVTRGAECDAVWNPQPGSMFLLPEVTWVHVLLIRPNPPDPDQEYLPL